VAEGHAGDQPLTTPAAAVCRRHVGLGPGFVDEDQAMRIEADPLLEPGRAPRLDIRTIQLRCRQCLFLRVIFSRWKNRRIEP
jgi:hypothetical protein